MKKVILSAFLLFVFTNGFSQFLRVGPKLGVSSTDFTINNFTSLDGLNDVGSSVKSGNARLGVHAGLFARVTLGPLFVQPELLFTNAGGQIIEEYNQPIQEVSQAVLNYNYNKLDVPIMVGYKFMNFLRVQAGPSFSYLLSSDVREDLSGNKRDVLENYNQATVGYRAGIGLDIWKLYIDFNYEGSLGKYGTTISSPAGSFSTDQRQNQFMLSVGLSLFELF